MGATPMLTEHDADPRRRHDRVPIRGGVLAASAITAPRPLELRLVNVSESGIAMAAVEPLAPGTRLRILAGVIGLEGVIEGEVGVRWCGLASAGWLLGAEFTAPSVTRDSLVAALRRTV